MDNLTHTLTAVALSQAGLHRKTRFATLTLIAAVNLPDLDFLSRLWGSATYLKYHRGFTHSILGVSLLAFLWHGPFTFWAAKQSPNPDRHPAFRWLLILAWIGTASHLFMDFTNSYGVRPFLPFSPRWYAWDIMFIFDPLLLLFLCLGLGFPRCCGWSRKKSGRANPARRGVRSSRSVRCYFSGACATSPTVAFWDSLKLTLTLNKTRFGSEPFLLQSTPLSGRE